MADQMKQRGLFSVPDQDPGPKAEKRDPFAEMRGKQGTCKSARCQQGIIFGITKNNKAIPLDPAPSYRWIVPPGAVRVDPQNDEKPLKRLLGIDYLEVVDTYDSEPTCYNKEGNQIPSFRFNVWTSHFETCPDSKKFRSQKAPPF